MMYTLLLDLDSAAMRDEDEPEYGSGSAVAQILRKLADKYEDSHFIPRDNPWSEPVLDVYGNTVGRLTISG